MGEDLTSGGLDGWRGTWPGPEYDGWDRTKLLPTELVNRITVGEVLTQNADLRARLRLLKKVAVPLMDRITDFLEYPALLGKLEPDEMVRLMGAVRATEN